jgi:hypothetical protein
MGIDSWMKIKVERNGGDLYSGAQSTQVPRRKMEDVGRLSI